MTALSIRLAGLLMLLLVAGRAQAQTGAELAGLVTFNGVPAPGVTVTATRGDARVSTTSDAAGTYRLRGLDAGTWTVTTALVGFAPASIEVVVPPTGPVPVLTLTVLPLDQVDVVRSAPAASATTPGTAPASPPAPGARTASTQGAAQPPAVNSNANANATANANAPAPGPAPATAFPGDGSDDAASAADGFLINGSVNNGAASPFAQARAFGNNRPGGRALYTGGVGLLSSHSALDARQFSFTGARTPKPAYNDLQFVANVGGPLRLPSPRSTATSAATGSAGTTKRRRRPWTGSRQSRAGWAAAPPAPES